MAVFVCGCRAPGALPDDEEPETGRSPKIVDIRVTCEPARGTWRVEVDTDAWSTGGVVLWTVDGEWVETHEILKSVRAAPDGTSDLLRGDLTTVTDFRPAGSGGDTLFGCRDAPSTFLWVLGPRGGIRD